MPDYSLANQLRVFVQTHRVNKTHLARKLCVEHRTLVRWLAAPESNDRSCPPWSAVELTRRMFAAGELKIHPPAPSAPLPSP